MLIAERAADVTATGALPVTAEAVAEMTVAPMAIAPATPLLLMLTTLLEELLHEEEFVRSRALPSV